jgi:hypothetical protein
LFFSRVFLSGTVNKYKSKVQLGKFHNKTSGLVASGVPPHIHLLQGQERMNEKYDDMVTSVDSQFKGLTKAIQTGFTDLPGNISNKLRQSFEISGAVPLTTQDLSEQLEEFKKTILATMADAMNRPTTTAAANVVQQPLLPSLPTDDSYAIFRWDSDNTNHPVPENFELPSKGMNCAQIFRLYCFGITTGIQQPNLTMTKPIRPFKLFERADLRPRDRITLSKLKTICGKLYKYACEVTPPVTCIENLTPDDFSQRYNQAFRKLCDENNVEWKTRTDLLVFTTFNNAITRAKKKRRIEEQDDDDDDDDDDE